jgi:hypothetical protein
MVERRMLSTSERIAPRSRPCPWPVIGGALHDRNGQGRRRPIPQRGWSTTLHPSWTGSSLHRGMWNKAQHGMVAAAAAQEYEQH